MKPNRVPAESRDAVYKATKREVDRTQKLKEAQAKRDGK